MGWGWDGDGVGRDERVGGDCWWWVYLSQLKIKGHGITGMIAFRKYLWGASIV